MLRELARTERFGHAALALALALFAGVTTLLRPLDIVAWSLQSKLIDRSASGDIVFVEMDGAQATVADNRHIEDQIEALTQAGAQRIFVNIPLQRSGSPSADASLRRTIVDHRDRIILTDATEQDRLDSDRIPPTDRYFSAGIRTVASDYDADFLGFVWGFEASQELGAGRKQALSFALASKGEERDRVFIDYTIKPRTVPVLSGSISTDDALDAGIRGKTVVLGTRSFASGVKIPGSGSVSPTMIHILSAETLDRQAGRSLSWFVLPLAFGFALLAAIAALPRRRTRRIFYSAWFVAAACMLPLASALGMLVVQADLWLLAAVYGLMRAISLYRRRHLFVDPISRLPNFSALRKEVFADADPQTTGLVVSKIARLDSIFANLSAQERRIYLRKIAGRLSVADKNLVVYSDGGKYLAFAVSNYDSVDLHAHLEGLRAITSQPIDLPSGAVDVSLTFGADVSSPFSLENRLSSAIAAADQAREAYRPVFVVSADEAETWDHSLSARLAQAIADDEISIKLQFQADFSSGQLIGAEVLARWSDHEGNEIPPSNFIPQCERMGRLDDLTRCIIEKSFATAADFQAHGHFLHLSINVSAVQFVDERIVEIIDESLKRHDFDPNFVKIEITETARIEDFETARAIVEKIKSRGFAFSIDDFGVGSANYETLLKLPFDEIKVDREFTSALISSDKARGIVAGIIHFARATGIDVVAEGIENQVTYDLLVRMGCTVGQGYFVARPLSPQAALRHLVEERIRAVQRGQHS